MANHEFAYRDEEKIANYASRGWCAVPGPYGRVCTNERGINHDYSHYDSGADSSWNDDWWQDAPTPEIVVLCGSTRFFHEFQVANYEQTMAGKIVLSVGFYAGSPDQMVQEHGEGVGITPEEKIALDELHKRKIDLADKVLVLNVGGYIGESTASEIAYAESIDRPSGRVFGGPFVSAHPRIPDPTCTCGHPRSEHAYVTVDGPCGARSDGCQKFARAVSPTPEAEATEPEPGIYTVAMIPITAGAKRATTQVNLEYVAKSSAEAIERAIADCRWTRPRSNFAWRIIARRVLTEATK